MNIYDEAKVITHEEARNKVKSNHNKFYTEGEFTKDMLDYINQQKSKEERAKKVEELLEDYKYLLSIIDLSDLPQVKIIKHKEKELEEMK